MAHDTCWCEHHEPNALKPIIIYGLWSKKENVTPADIETLSTYAIEPSKVPSTGPATAGADITSSVPTPNQHKNKMFIEK